ncbi:hypothetical protein [Enteractinococcus helveticum]|uniref:Uncharacterized protein n=1 Tax=Enteractinococcus helveticum TaxID=1837282 RepID=A0A1B7LYK0_9MICC|nr:hypothetical protein [Enteractinococcus helveticum]OAV60494.1 hypothetical protein A6F49_11045 [Enteractinococcus helveticum]
MSDEAQHSPRMQGAWKILLLLAVPLMFMGWLTIDLTRGALEATGWAAGRAWLSAVVTAGLTVFFGWLMVGFGLPWFRYLRRKHAARSDQKSLR